MKIWQPQSDQRATPLASESLSFSTVIVLTTISSLNQWQSAWGHSPSSTTTECRLNQSYCATDTNVVVFVSNVGQFLRSKLSVLYLWSSKTKTLSVKPNESFQSVKLQLRNWCKFGENAVNTVGPTYWYISVKIAFILGQIA